MRSSPVRRPSRSRASLALRRRPLSHGLAPHGCARPTVNPEKRAVGATRHVWRSRADSRHGRAGAARARATRRSRRSAALAPAAAAAAPAGMRPTSSEPATSAPRAARLRLDPRDDLVQRGRLPVLDVHAHLRRARRAAASRPSARTPGKAAARLAHDAPRSRVATSTSAPRRLTLKAISGRRAPTSTRARRARRAAAGPKSGASSPASTRRCSSSGPPRRKNAGPRPAPSSP